MSAPFFAGPQFADVQPKNAAGALSPTAYTVAAIATATTLDLGTITRVTPYGAFTEGQDIIFWINVVNKTNGAAFNDLVRLKLWWLRSNVQFRTPGDTADGGWLGGASTTGTIDGTTFGGATDVNNRGVWIPETRGIMIVPPTIPDRNVGYDMHDVVWEIRLGDPATFGLLRNITFGWKAYGRALGFTSDYTFSGAQAPAAPTLSISYKTGFAGGALVAPNQVL